MRGKKVITLLSICSTLGLLAAGCGSEPQAQPNSEIIEIQGSALEMSQDSSSDASQETPQDGQGSSEGRWHVLEPEMAEALDADFEGFIWKIGENSFYISEMYSEILEDGSLIGAMPAPEDEIPDSELIQVVFDDDTYFYIRTIYNGGERHEDSDAGSEDLEEYMSVDLKGSFKEDVFYATEVRMIKVN